jgi:dephospho-CoA kinase
MERDQTSRDAAEDLINIQMSDEEKIRRADYVLRNEGSMEQLIESVGVLFENLTKITKR